MTLASTTSKASYSGNGTTVAFSVPFYFLADEDLVVTLRNALGVETVKTLTTDYTVSGAEDQAGGTVTMVVAPATGETLVISRDPSIVQETDYSENDSFPAETHERALDRLTMISQALAEKYGRSVTVKISSGISGVELPTAEAGKALTWNSAEDGLENSDLTLATLGVTMNTQEFTATNGQTLFTITNGWVYDTAANNISVYLNGRRLDSSEYTKTSTSSVTLAVGAVEGDRIVLVSSELDSTGDYGLLVIAAQAAQAAAELAETNAETAQGLAETAQAAAEAAAASVITVNETHVWTAGQDVDTTALTSASGSVALDLSTGGAFTLDMTENTTIAAPSNKPSGDDIRTTILIVTQHASSAKTMSWNSVFKFAGGSVPDLSTGASAVDVFTIVATSGNLYVVASQDMK